MDEELRRRFWFETPDAAIATAPNGSILSWNDSAERLFGYSAAEALGKSIDALICPDETLAETEQRSEAVYEAVRRRKDGTLVYISCSRKTVTHAEGSYVLYTKKDITALKVGRDASLIEGRFGAILESTPDAIAIVNPLGRIVFVNSRAGDVFDYSREELIGQPIEMLLPERFRTAHHRQRVAFLRQPRARAMGVGIELYGLRRGGDEFPVEISLSPLTTDVGTMVMSAVRDITERRTAELKFRGILESAPDAMVIVDLDGRIALVNSQVERLFGYRREELIGHDVEMLIPPRYRRRHQVHRSGFVTEPRVRSMGEGLELYGVRADGSEFPVEISLSPFQDGAFVCSAIRDATERRRMERTLREANRLKSEFLTNMSHELRTPLNGIIGFSELLIDGKVGALNAQQKDYLRDVHTSGLHLLRLINDILDLSKIEAGKMSVVTETFRLATVVEEVCSVLSPLARKKEIAIQQEISGELPPVRLDRGKLVQILYNLVSNALKFTAEGGEVRVLAGRGAAPEHLRISVRDTGIGIRAADFPKLFVEFQQLDSGLTRKHEGSGLGLALTKRLVELQHGSIAVESEPGRGSTFTVELPLRLPESVAAA